MSFLLGASIAISLISIAYTEFCRVATTSRLLALEKEVEQLRSNKSCKCIK